MSRSEGEAPGSRTYGPGLASGAACSGDARGTPPDFSGEGIGRSKRLANLIPKTR